MAVMLETRFAAYVAALAGALAHADRKEPFSAYCRGLILPGARKSVEPMAALTDPARTASKHQSLLHFVANAPWSERRCCARCAGACCPRSRPLA